MWRGGLYVRVQIKDIALYFILAMEPPGSPPPALPIIGKTGKKSISQGIFPTGRQ